MCEIAKNCHQSVFVARRNKVLLADIQKCYTEYALIVQKRSCFVQVLFYRLFHFEFQNGAKECG